MAQKTAGEVLGLMMPKPDTGSGEQTGTPDDAPSDRPVDPVLKVAREGADKHREHQVRGSTIYTSAVRLSAVESQPQRRDMQWVRDRVAQIVEQLIHIRDDIVAGLIDGTEDELADAASSIELMIRHGQQAGGAS